ncbi:MAG: hypothetical protein ABEK29_04225, partial [Bradymonadaceae bacterium]
NQTGNLSAYFTSRKLRVTPNVGEHDGDPESLDIRLAGYGRRGSTRSLAPAASVSADGHRIEYRRDGLVEWYDNGREG